MQYKITQLIVGIVVCDVGCTRFVMRELFYVCFRAAGSGGIQRATSELGQRLWPLPAPPAGPSRALLHSVPVGHQERSRLWVALHLLVTWPVSCKFYHPGMTMRSLISRNSLFKCSNRHALLRFQIKQKLIYSLKKVLVNRRIKTTQEPLLYLNRTILFACSSKQGSLDFKQPPSNQSEHTSNCISWDNCGKL